MPNNYNHPLTEFTNKYALEQHLIIDHELGLEVGHIAALRREHERAHQEIAAKRVWRGTPGPKA